MPKINTQKVIVDYQGEPLVSQDKKTTYRDVLINALNYESGGESGAPKRVLTQEQKSKIYQLSAEIATKEEVSLKSEDVVFIKECVSLIYNPLVYGQVETELEK